MKWLFHGIPHLVQVNIKYIEKTKEMVAALMVVVLMVVALMVVVVYI